jgi:hypothetical protein
MMVRQQEKLEEISRKPAEQPAAPVAVAQNEPPPAPPAPAPKAEPVKAEAAVPAKAETPPEPQKNVQPPAEAKKEPERVAERQPEKVEKTERTEAHRESKKGSSLSKRDAEPAPEPKRAPEPAKVAQSSGGNDDDFESMFGDKKSAPKAAAQPAKSARAVYVPPAPGQVDIPEKLGQSDIMQVVLQNKAALATCAQEQKKRDPSLSGKLVVRWSIQTNGKTSKVAPQTAEFKNTYMATCVSNVIKQMHFPAHKVEGDPIDFPFSF